MKRLLVSLLAVSFLFCLVQPLFAADTVTCWFPPGWKKKASQAQMITKSLSSESGIKIRPRIARNYPEILTAFATDNKNLVYVGSFVQAIIAARNLGTPLVQNVNGKELYSGILITPNGVDSQMVLVQSPAKIAFAVGASSGESSAKAATQGKAAIGVANHGAAVGAVKAGRAKAAVVKNWWWDARAKDYPEMSSYQIPGVSVAKNPDNVLTASKAVSGELQKKIKAAAVASSSAFGKGADMQPFDASKLAFTLDLMKKGKIDPLTYSW
jgi:ABC-type phosphate/phosphonate transport system substrate-binding protein